MPGYELRMINRDKRSEDGIALGCLADVGEFILLKYGAELQTRSRSVMQNK